MTWNRKKWKIDQSLKCKGTWNVTAHGKCADSHNDQRGHRESFDNERWHDVVAGGEFRPGNAVSSNAGRDRSSCKRRRFCDNRQLGRVAHVTGPAQYNRSDAPCVIQGDWTTAVWACQRLRSHLVPWIRSPQRDPTAGTVGSHSSVSAGLRYISSVCEYSDNDAGWGLEESRGNDGSVETGGKAKPAFPQFPPPLGNLANSARFPHFHSPPRPFILSKKQRPERRRWWSRCARMKMKSE